MNRSIVVTGTSVLLALAVGSAATAHLQPRAHPEVRVVQVEATPPPTAAPLPPPDYGALENRLRQLEVRAATPALSAESPATPAAAPPSDEDARHHVLAMKSAREAQVANEANDPAWSREAATTVRKELEALGSKHGFTIEDLDCRTTSCLAKLSWGSYADARRSWRSVLHARSEKKCATEVFVPPPESDQAASTYEGTVFLDCTEDRAQ